MHFLSSCVKVTVSTVIATFSSLRDLNICQMMKAFSPLSIFVTALCTLLLKCCSSVWPNYCCSERHIKTLLQLIILLLSRWRLADLPSRIETLCCISFQCSIVVFWYNVFHVCGCKCRWQNFWWVSATVVRSGYCTMALLSCPWSKYYKIWLMSKAEV